MKAISLSNLLAKTILFLTLGAILFFIKESYFSAQTSRMSQDLVLPSIIFYWIIYLGFYLIAVFLVWGIKKVFKTANTFLLFVGLVLSTPLALGLFMSNLDFTWFAIIPPICASIFLYSTKSK